MAICTGYREFIKDSTANKKNIKKSRKGDERNILHHAVKTGVPIIWYVYLCDRCCYLCLLSVSDAVATVPIRNHSRGTSDACVQYRLVGNKAYWCIH